MALTQNGQEEGEQVEPQSAHTQSSELWTWGFALYPASPGYFLPGLPVKGQQYGNQRFSSEDN